MQKFPAGQKAQPESHELVTLGDLRKLIPGRRPAPTTLDNWCRYGVSGVKLEHEWRGAWRFSSLAWYRDFQRKIAEARNSA